MARDGVVVPRMRDVRARLTASRGE
jgi:hypothetical protein